MKLYLLRHGEACSPEENISRPLTQQGRDQVLRVAKFLQSQNNSIVDIYHSGVLRAEQTAELVASVIAPDIKLNKIPALNNIAELSTIVSRVDAFTDDTLLVGHIPVLPGLVGACVIQNANALLVEFQLATLLCLEKIDFGRWCIEWVVTPDILIKK